MSTTRLEGDAVTQLAQELVGKVDSMIGQVRESSRTGRRVMSFQEYVELFASAPGRYGRDASRYVRDMFDHYGTQLVDKPTGKTTRFRLFDLEFSNADATRERLIGQEDTQAEIYRILCNFAREGRPNKLILLHGPNGSSKSTIASCLMRALEHYSQCDEGALYRFHWVFPSAKTIRSKIGFKEDGTPKLADDVSFAHLEDDLIDARLNNEIRDHPLFLLSVEQRASFIQTAYAAHGITEQPPEWLTKGRLSHKSQQVYEALLSSYRGDLKQVFRHVMVERYFISRRYRVGAVTIGPQMSVDAGERQITADRSLAALPPSLQAVALFDAVGELVDASGGILELSDLLKRPIDAYKYLQISIETGEISLQHQNVQLNHVLIGSANEVHLAALREHPEWASFRGRFDLIRTPYLRSYLEEKQIYDAQIAPQIQRHVAPHATLMAAFFAVLTRMRKAQVEHLPGPLGVIASGLSVIEKADMYAKGVVPERLDAEQSKLLRSRMADVFRESRHYPVYEGRVGASPREIKTVLLDAAQHPQYGCLSPLAVLEALEKLSGRVSEYEWLQQDVLSGGYHDVKLFREAIKNRLTELWEEELRNASGLVEEKSYFELFERYVRYVSVWVKKEKVRNPVTGAYEDPDVKLMEHVEKLLKMKGDASEFRKSTMSQVAAWSIEHPGEKLETEKIFGQHIRKLKETAFVDRKKAMTDVCKYLIEWLEDGGKSLNSAQQKSAEETFQRMQSIGYCKSCARDAASHLLRWRLL